MAKPKIKVGSIVTPKENYRQQIAESGEKLQVGKKYEVDSWFSFYGSTMVILKTGEYVYKYQLDVIADDFPNKKEEANHG